VPYVLHLILASHNGGKLKIRISKYEKRNNLKIQMSKIKNKALAEDRVFQLLTFVFYSSEFLTS